MPIYQRKDTVAVSGEKIERAMKKQRPVTPNRQRALVAVLRKWMRAPLRADGEELRFRTENGLVVASQCYHPKNNHLPDYGGE